MGDTRENALVVSHVHKTFRLPKEHYSGLKQLILTLFKRNKQKGYELQHVLKGVSFEIKKGEFFGIVGRNGSGKSTLLKTIAGIYTPDKGHVQVNGKLVPFIELGVGFNPELTGRENVFLNGALLGFSRAEMDTMYDDIVDFAELGRFMDQKLKNYSSGMQVRLAFSVAIRARGDILLLDEVLAVGDEAFQRKCNDYFKTLKENKQTVILVTHDMGAIKKFCDKAVFLNKGEVESIGTPEDIANLYTEENFKVEDKQNVPEINNQLDLKVTSPHKRVVSSDQGVVFNIEFETTNNNPVYAAFSLIDMNRSGSVLDVRSANVSKKGKNSLTYKIPLDNINNGDFMVTAIIDDVNTKRRVAFTTDKTAFKFAIRNSKQTSNGLLKELGEWIDG